MEKDPRESAKCWTCGAESGTFTGPDAERLADQWAEDHADEHPNHEIEREVDFE
jgi:hypothetical protein